MCKKIVQIVLDESEYILYAYLQAEQQASDTEASRQVWTGVDRRAMAMCGPVRKGAAGWARTGMARPGQA
jgi:hypothetical protein